MIKGFLETDSLFLENPKKRDSLLRTILSINFKKLDLSQMGNLQGATNGRNCTILGFVADAALALSPINLIGWATTVGISGGVLVTAMASDCF